MKNFFLYILLLATVACSATVNQAESPSFILATTTSTQDSGLLDELVPMFEANSGFTVQTVAVGTGAALKMAEEGNADVLLVHAPPAEEALMAAGFGKDRLLVMHNDFVIVGPSNDPAGITNISNVATAFAKIAESESTFLSRGDDSGTNKKELAIWANTSFSPNDTKPEWYIESGQGMGASLVIASQKSAYTMTDRATYLATQKNLDLDILLEGDAVLLNIYHVITVNPDRWDHVKYEEALAFAEFMTSADTQAIIAEFGMDIYDQPLFFPDAGKDPVELGLK